MSSGKKRLSQGSGFLGVPIENEDDLDCEFADTTPVNGSSNRKSIGGRRRSSFGSSLSGSKSPQKTAEEQNRIAEMYKMVIKMSTENKINEKNSWSLDLIDHMGKLIRDEGRGVNFQKASCTLDASVKIYSHRVDDTHASSHRILESLSRNTTSGGDDDVAETRGNAKVGSKVASSRLNIAETIEKNIENINAAKIEASQNADPLFQKMSKAFDEGGAKGMLMNNMRVAPSSCNLIFSNEGLSVDTDTSDTVFKTTASHHVSNMVDISDIIFRSGIDISSLRDLEVCPALSGYRAMIGIQDSDVGMCAFAENTSGPYYSCNAQSTFPGPTANSTNPPAEACGAGLDNFFDADGDDDYGGFNVADYGDDDNEDGFVQDEKATSANPRSSLSSDAVPPKIAWENVFNDGATVSDADLVSPTPGHDLIENPAVIVTANDEYSYFDIASLVNTNAWAGAKHWKFVSRPRGCKVVPNVATSESAGSATGAAIQRVKKAAAKEKFSLCFSLSLVDDVAFTVPPKGKLDSTIMTAAMIEKSNAQSDSLLLPPDAQLQVNDLCRLFLCPKTIIRPPNLLHMIRISSSTSSMQSASDFNTLVGYGDKLWGDAGTRRAVVGSTANPISSMAAAASAPVTGAEFDDDNDNDYGDSGYDDCGYGDTADDDCEMQYNTARGLEINTGKLIQAPRLVQKIDVGYARQTTKVNVRKLKMDIWSHIDGSVDRGIGNSVFSDLQADENIDPEAASMADISQSAAKNLSVSSLPPGQLSFQELISDVGYKQQQQGVSLSFYFICLLHLANEKTLRIDGNSELSDLTISKETL